MSRISYTHQYGERFELEEARTGFQPTLEAPAPERTDTMYDGVFQDALERLGLDGLETRHDAGQNKLVAPEGYKFRVTGAFTIWPDGNDIAWGYGPPTDSYEQWQLSNQERERDEWESEGDRDDSGTAPDIHFYHGGTLTLEFDDVGWGSVARVDRKSRRSSDDEPATVRVTVQGYRKTWFEQARRFIQLPNSSGDRLLTTHEYGQPGIIPCWEGEYAEGDINQIKVELVPIDGDEGDEQLPVLKKLWVPEGVRWSVYEDYPDLIDQHGDFQTRTGFGGAMRVLGGLASAFGGREGNAFDRESVSNLSVIDDPMVAHMDLDKLAALVEQMIESSNNDVAPNPEAKERAERIASLREKKRKQLVVITDVNQPLREIVRDVGESDEWLDAHVKYVSSFY